MKIRYITFIYFILSAQYYTLCNQGCLQCSNNQQDVCLICDKTLNFKKVGDSCQKIQIQNCQNLDSTFNCTSCIDPYYPSPDGQECLLSQNILLNCSERSEEQKCHLCNQNFYPLNGQCQAVNVQQPNCIQYGEGQDCIQCSQQYIYSPYLKKCIKKPDNNCQIYDQVYCQQCEQNYVIKQKNNFDLIQISNFFNQNIIEKNQFCQQLNQIDQNCQEQDLTGCNFCKEGFYIDQGTCKSFGQSQSNVQEIDNCIRYLSNTQCQTCDNNYYPSLDRLQCLPQPSNFNCDQISNDQFGPICINCSQEKFLFQNQCIQRSNYVINNCQTYSLDQDKCEVCDITHELDLTQTFCQPLNCQQYDINTQQCTKCQDRFYLNNQICQSGSVSNCLEYIIDQDICQVCDYTQRYELNNNGQCQQTLPLVENCNEQSQVENSCDQCNEEAITLEINKICQQKNIQNCIQYNQQGGCQQCSGQLIPSQDQLNCVSQDLENCEEYTNNICQKCIEGYRLFNSLCIKVFPFLQENCYQNSLQDQSAISLNDSCKICNEDTYPVQSNSTCIGKDFIQLQTYYIQHCISYLFETCIQCEQGKFLSQDFQCIDQCQEYQSSYVIKLHNQNILLKDYCRVPMNECDIFTIGITQKFSQQYLYHCQQCKQNYINVIINFNQNNALINLQKTTENQFQYQNFVPRVQCINQNDSNIIDIVPNCDYYGKIHPDSNLIGCIKCKFGYRDQQPFQFQIVQDNTQCQTFDSNNLCIECNDGYSLDDQGFCYMPKTYYENCQEVIPFCDSNQIQGFDSLDLLLFTCHQCQQNTNGQAQYPVMSSFENQQEVYNTQHQSGHMIECMTIQEINSYQQQSNLDTNCQYYKLLTINGQQQMKCVGCKQGFYNKSNDPNQIQCEVFITGLTIDNNQYGFPNINFTTFSYGQNINQDNIFLIQNRQRINGHFVQNQFGQLLECVKGKEQFGSIDCIDVNIPKCLLSDQALQVNSFDPIFVLIDMLNDKDYGHGCLQCIDDLISLNGPITLQCHQPTQSITSNPLSFFLSVFNKQNCLRFGYDDQANIVCKQCKVNYRLVNGQSNQPCESFTYPEGCIELTLSQNECFICDTNYVLLNGQCFLKNINQCEAYDFQSELICIKCQDGFYYNGQDCIQGTIDNCQLFLNNGQCSKCQAPFVLLNPMQCISIQFSSELNCNQFGYDGNAQFQCLQCRDLYVEQLLDNSILQCLFQEIPNCTNYESSINDLSIQCTQCEQSKILTNGNCEQSRSVSITYCEEYEPEQERCKVCQAGSLLLQNGFCDIPVSIDNCKNYLQNFAICNECEQNYILNQNQTQCNLRQEIFNCQVYDNDYNCIECQDLYYLSNGQCMQLTLIENCEEYSKEQDQCLLCIQGYHLLNDNCQKDSDSTIPIQNCLNHSNLLTCQQCQSGYYFNSITGNCEIVITTQMNCDLYDNQQQCIKCEYPYEFDVDENGIQYCRQPEFEGCLISPEITYYGIDQCIQCTEDHFFYYNKCFPIQESTLQLCEIISAQNQDIDQQIFQKCLQDLNIANCEQLGKTTGECIKCSQGYVLFDGDKCIKEQNINQNCLSKVAGQLECVMCQDGYQLVNNNCEQVQQDDGCFIYDENNLCQTCKFGYHQEQYGSCIKVQIIYLILSQQIQLFNSRIYYLKNFNLLKQYLHNFKNKLYLNNLK